MMSKPPDSNPQHKHVPPSLSPRVVDSTQLFDRHNTINIRHDGQLYTLRLTASNKLILTK